MARRSSVHSERRRLLPHPQAPRTATLVSLDARLIAAAKGVGHPVLTDAPEGAN